jgi:hypothetical protein
MNTLEVIKMTTKTTTTRLLVQNEDYTWSVLILDEDNVVIDADEPTQAEIDDVLKTRCSVAKIQH